MDGQMDGQTDVYLCPSNTRACIACTALVKK